jgi:hypothetical protein
VKLSQIKNTKVEKVKDVNLSERHVRIGYGYDKNLALDMQALLEKSIQRLIATFI